MYGSYAGSLSTCQKPKGVGNEVPDGLPDVWTTQVRSWTRLRDDIAVCSGSKTLVHLDVLRHGETVRNREHRISGSAETDLTVRGSTQAATVGGSLSARYDVAFNSGLRRSIETLSIALGASSASTRVTVRDERLAERSMGVLEGADSRAIPESDRGDLGWAPSGGEAYISVVQRILSFLLDLRNYARGTDHDLRALVSTHVGPMRILTSILDGTSDPAAVLTRQFPNAALWSGVVHRIDWPAFLPEDLSEVISE